jgi:hypothetical protein
MRWQSNRPERREVPGDDLEEGTSVMGYRWENTPNKREILFFFPYNEYRRHVQVH